jgi:hypothetical protein
MLFKIFSPKKIGEKNTDSYSNYSWLGGKKNQDVGFQEKKFRRKWGKIAENIDHNIDPIYEKSCLQKSVAEAENRTCENRFMRKMTNLYILFCLFLGELFPSEVRAFCKGLTRSFSCLLVDILSTSVTAETFSEHIFILDLR